MSVRVLCGDAIERLREVEAGSVHCCVCSPPYYGLRAYLPDGHPDKHLEIGGEATPAQWVAKLVAVFGEVRRVLRDDATLWVNCGSCYADDTKWGGATGGKHVNALHGQTGIGRQKRETGYKPGDRIMLATMLAEALRTDGWFLRDAVVWSKTSPMPESVSGWRWEQHRIKAGKDDAGRTIWEDCPGCAKCADNDGLVLRKGSWRHTNSYEMVFQFAKTAEYFGDGEAVRETAEFRPWLPGRENHIAACPGGNNRYSNGPSGFPTPSTGRNPRNVWTLGPDPLTDEHYAAFPREIPRRAILASTSAKGVCHECGAPYARVVERERGKPSDVRGYQAGVNGASPFITHGQGSPNAVVGPNYMQFTPRGGVGSKELGWRPTCTCEAGDPIPATILDCFAGSGTTGVVADELGRDAILIELSQDYAAMAERRVAKARARRMLGDAPRYEPLPGQASLFDRVPAA